MPLSKTLTQHISWRHGNINGDDLAQLGSYMDNTWHNLVQLGVHLAKIENRNTYWKLDGQHFSAWVSFGCHLGDYLERTSAQWAAYMAIFIMIN